MGKKALKKKIGNHLNLTGSLTPILGALVIAMSILTVIHINTPQVPQKFVTVKYSSSWGINCLWDLLYMFSSPSNKPDEGGCWNINTLPINSTLTEEIIDAGGEEPGCNGNPCLDIASFGCGQYIFEYIYESTTCENCADTSYMTINVACCEDLNGVVMCE